MGYCLTLPIKRADTAIGHTDKSVGFMKEVSKQDKFCRTVVGNG